jgi:glycerol-3-phosphate acyltransferase PlsY
MLTLVAVIVLSYLLGSVSGSLLLGRFKGVDIRTQGSGNAGGTNAFRTQGALFALGVIAIDVGKGALAAGTLPGLAGELLHPVASEQPLNLALACGFAAVLGHVYPLYHRFHGGKGAGTFVGVLLVTEPILVLPVVAVWLVVLITTGYVGLSTMLAALALFPSVILLAKAGVVNTWLVFAAVAVAFILFTHRSNIQRLNDGSEHRFEKVRLFRKPDRETH